MREAPARDRAVGLEYFVSETDGIGGQLKVEPEDFRVVEVGEIDPEPLEADPSDYPYVLLGVTLRQWETHAFVDRLGGELGVGRRAIDWAGTKDKHAVTEQLFSVAWDPDAFPAVDIDGARIEPIGRFGRRLHFGDLLGNTFQIRVRCPVHPERVDAITDELVAFGAGSPAVPNYFGHQRFGSLRPVTHEVGRALLSEGWEAAVMTYLCLSTDEEPPETQAARSFIRETRDWERGLERMPRRLGYERTLLSSLAEAGDPEEADFREALDRLPRSLGQLFVHALQAYLFNRLLSERMGSGDSLFEAEVGDVVCFGHSHPTLGRMPDMETLQRVTEARLETINRHLRRQRAWLTLPLIGTETTFADGRVGQIERAVLQAEGISRSAFALPEPYNSEGTRRAAVVSTAVSVSQAPLTFEFSLPSGSYATVVLREFLKEELLEASAKPDSSEPSDGDESVDTAV